MVRAIQCTPFSVLTDESTDISTDKAACVLVKYCNFESQKIETKIFSLTNVFSDTKIASEGGANAENLFNNLMADFENSNFKIDPKNFIGFASDGCNVMFGCNNSVASRISEKFPGITLMKCICHSLHLCASDASITLPKRCEELMKNVYSYFSRSSKRMIQFENFQKLNEVTRHRLLQPAQTRWLSVQAAVERLVEQWPALVPFFQDVKNRERSLAVDNITNDLCDPFIKLLFLFLNFILPKITNLNTYFQTSASVITELDSRMRATYEEILLMYLDRNYIKQRELGKVNPAESNQYLRPNAMYLGIDVMREIQAYQNQKGKHQKIIDDFIIYVRKYLVALCMSISKRYDFNDRLFSYIGALSPVNAVCSNYRIKCPSLCSLMDAVPRITAFFDKPQLIDDDWRLLPSIELPDDIQKCVKDGDAEQFWFKLYDLKTGGGFPVLQALPLFALFVLCLPLSTSDCERSFSKMNLIKTKFRNRLQVSTVEGCLLSSQLVKNSGGCTEFKPTKTMLDHMTSSNLYPKKEDAIDNNVNDLQTFGDDFDEDE